MTAVVASAGVNEVALTWALTRSGPEPEGIYVEVAGPGGRVVAIPGPQTQTRVSGLRNGVEYSFRVTAASRDGSAAPSAWVRATPTTGMEGEVAGLIVEFAENLQVSQGAESVPGEDRVTSVELSVAERVSDDAVLVEFSEPVGLDAAEQIADELAADELVEWAEPDQFFFTSSMGTSTDAWNLTGTYGVDAMASDERSRAGEGAGTTVAVIDTGITAHPDLDPSLVGGYDFVSSPEQLMASRQPNAPPVAFDADYTNAGTFGAIGRDANPADPGDWSEVTPARDSSWHGTHIAGVISSVAPGARIQPVRALSWRGGLLSDIAASITWASGGTIDGVPANASPSKVINMSFAVETICPVALQGAIDAARDRGSILIAAAGNASDDAAKFAPGNCNGVITVGATNEAGSRADYSNYGTTIDISAPGGDATTPVISTSNTGTQTPDQPGTAPDFGTSVSAAHVSAAAAILSARNTTITPDEAFTALTGRELTKNFANPTCDTTNPDYTCGTGILSLAQIASVASGDDDYAMTFNGSSQNGVITTAGVANFLPTAAITFEAWAYPTERSRLQRVVNRGGALSIGVAANSTWFFEIGNYDARGTGGWASISGPSVSFDQWTHVALTRTGSTVTAYINGVQVGTGSANAAMPTTNNTGIGANGIDGGAAFSGRIDEVRFWSTARSQDEILTDMRTYGPILTSGSAAT